ncbi:DUF2284 domain-containing protein [Pseudoflavonifractor sp. 524-17]|uniref:DUF2284 domain-containing protein n=1 Tax=Pseudoflavonifractor sp. 524-17 TaxID=2304577 RepID=UPI00137AA536|nr:DUF2284 domain-containing protein [Pseudoflavonifractor sp. 524-17]
MNTSHLQQDLRRYCQLALEAGMTDAKVIPASLIRLDPRVRLKCRYPRCGYYGSNGNCPPYATPLSEMQACIDRYEFGVLFMKRFPSDSLLGARHADYGHAAGGDVQREMYRVAGRLERAAFRDGHVLAMAFANGPCKKVFCPNAECSAIQPGGQCRFPLKSRSSMEGCGIHVFALARSVGWEITPAGHTSTPEEVPELTNVGLVLVE